MGRTGAGSGPGAVCVGGRASRRQGQWPEGIRTGRGNVCVGRRPEGVTTGGTGSGPGGTSYVRAVGGGQQPERRVRPMMRFAVRVGGMRCGDHTHAQLPGIRTDGGARRLEPADKAEWVRRGAAAGVEWPPGSAVPGAGDVPEPGRQRVPWSRSGDRLLGKRLRPGTGSAAGAGRGNGIRTGCRNALARAAHGRDPRPCGYCM